MRDAAVITAPERADVGVVDDATGEVVVTEVVVVVGGRRKCAEVDLSVGADRVEHQGIHARREVDVSARDQVEIAELDRLRSRCRPRR